MNLSKQVLNLTYKNEELKKKMVLVKSEIEPIVNPEIELVVDPVFKSDNDQLLQQEINCDPSCVMRFSYEPTVSSTQLSESIEYEFPDISNIENNELRDRFSNSSEEDQRQLQIHNFVCEFHPDQISNFYLFYFCFLIWMKFLLN